MGPSTVAATLGQVGLPAPLAELTARAWDAVVVGGGYNGLTAAAYLARAGRSVLVLERRERPAAPAPWSSPSTTPATWSARAPMWSACSTRRSSTSWAWSATATRCSWPTSTCGCRSPTAPRWPSSSTTIAPWPTCGQPLRRARHPGDARLRGHVRLAAAGPATGPEGDTWRGDSPTREQLEKRLGHDGELISVLFEESIADTLDRYVTDQRMKDALYGQGVIGAWAAPATRAPPPSSSCTTRATWAARARCGAMSRAAWGRSSFAIAQAARDLSELATGVPVAEILPGEGCGWRAAS